RALAEQLTATNDNLQVASIATGEARRRAEVALEHASEAEREQARLARQNEELLARKDAVLRSTLDAIIAMDAHGKITEFNPAARHRESFAMGRRGFGRFARRGREGAHGAVAWQSKSNGGVDRRNTSIFARRENAHQAGAGEHRWVGQGRDRADLSTESRPAQR